MAQNKRFSSLLLALVLLVTLMSQFTLDASAEILSGTIRNTKIDWALDTDSGILTITGKGKPDIWPWTSTDDVEDYLPPWEVYGKAVEARVSDGIESIWSGMFYNCMELKRITIPNSVKSIDPFAFCGCSSLLKITFPFGVEKIGRGAFQSCNRLARVTIKNPNCEISETPLGNRSKTVICGLEGSTAQAYAERYGYRFELYSDFTDVPPNAYYAAAVAWAADGGITTGTAAGSFSPDDTCTRAQVVTFLWRAYGEPEPTSTNNPFTDVKKNAYYYKAVLWAAENGIASGTGSGKFSPNGGCTRGQVVTFLWRAAGKPQPKNTTNPFADVKKGAFYYDAVLWAAENGITTGTSPNTFSPNDICTRAQVATFLYRNWERMVVEESENVVQIGDDKAVVSNTRGNVCFLLWWMLDCPEPIQTENLFTDVSEDAYYYKAVLWAYYNQPQITKGTTSNLFSPEDPCTRGQVVAYLYRAVGEPKIEDTNNPFVDVEKNKYYYNAVLWAAETDWIDLAADGDEFLPNEYAKKISATKTSGGYTFAFQN